MSAAGAEGPWYVRAMLGIAGCLAALFLLAFVGLGLAFVVRNPAMSIVAGGLAILAAYGLLRALRGDFGAMFALAFSLAGQGLVLAGAFGVGERSAGAAAAVPWMVMILVEAALLVAMPNFIHRFAAACLAGVCLQMALAAAGAGALAAGILAMATLLAWHYEEPVGPPAGYGFALALIGAESAASWQLWRRWDAARIQLEPWVGEALAAAVFVAAVCLLLQPARWLAGRRTAFALAGAALLGAASLKAPGVASGLMIVLLGFAAGRRVLLGLGVAALLFYASSYYYQLDETLLYKSGVLAAIGALLLAARRLMLAWVPPGETRDA